MKPLIEELVKKARDPIEAKNLAREYLQARMLEGLQNSGAMIPLAFCGGTCLRFLYDLPRFSEDLDFSLERPEKGFNFRKILTSIQATFNSEGYRVSIKVNDTDVVNNAFIKFENLLFELGLSRLPSEILSIKLEVDTNPPQGAYLATSLVRRHVLLRIQHHDQASMLSGKLHAFLARNFTKGRDLYDLMWYLSDKKWPQPNLVLLANALRQSNWQGGIITEENWKQVIIQRLDSEKWAAIRGDVQSFLERPNELDLLTKENFYLLLR